MPGGCFERTSFWRSFPHSVTSVRLSSKVMPRIFDNIEVVLSSALRDSLKVWERAGFCISYFNLRGWKHIDRFIELSCGRVDRSHVSRISHWSMPSTLTPEGKMFMVDAGSSPLAPTTYLHSTCSLWEIWY